jgi:large subunit ribosomal protein L29
LKTSEIRALNDEELTKQLQQSERQLFDLRFSLVTRKLVNVREVERMRKDIARLKTIQREREMGLVPESKK